MTVISVEHLSKQYRLGLISGRTLSGDLNRWWAKARGRPDPMLKIGQEHLAEREGEYIWALRDVSFEVKQGEVLGIIGRNGAGKSTVLKILSRVTAPTSGEVKVKGRIASLLEVGTGFHPELTGRENIYLNGAILGMSRQEIARKFDEIVAFAEIEKFIDTPVKRYSSGMYVRLAFAVAAHLEPEILVVDEVLAVGDAAFQKRCLGKMGDVAKEGRTVLFVSHNMAAIEALCPRIILLENGEINAVGSTEVITMYLMKGGAFSGRADLTKHPGRQLHARQVFSTISTRNDGHSVTDTFRMGDTIVFQISLDPGEHVYRNPSISLTVFSARGLQVCKLATWAQASHEWIVQSRTEIHCKWPDCRLAPGKYFVNLGFSNGQQGIDYVEQALTLDIVSADIHGTGKIGTGVFVPDYQWFLPRGRNTVRPMSE